MNENDTTTVMKMLQDLKSETYSRNSGISMGLSEAGTSVPSHTNDKHSTAGLPRSIDRSVPDNYETPTKRKRLDSLQSPSLLNLSGNDTVPTSPWEWRRLKSEVVSLKTRLSHTEATVCQLHKIRREIEEIFAKEKNILEAQAELDKQTIKQLELRVEASRKSTHEAREAQAAIEAEMYQVKTKLEQKIIVLFNENARLKDSIVHSKSEESPSLPLKSEQPDNEAQLKLEASEKRIRELEEKVKEHLLSEQQFELQNVELQSLKIKIEKLESEKALWEEGKLMLSKAARANELEKELQYAKDVIVNLRAVVKGKLLLEEQMCNMEKRVQHTEIVERQVAILDIKCEELTSKLKEFESLGIGTTSAAVKHEIFRLQQAEAVLMLEEGKLRSQVNALTRENDNLQKKYDETRKMATDMTNSTEKLNKFIVRLQKKMLLVSKERDSYRQQMDLYEKEMTTLEGTNVVTERVQSLDRILEGYKDMVDKLETDLSMMSDPETLHAREQCTTLKKEVEKLKGELEHRALKGDFNINSRIVHFKMNPAAIASQQAEDKQKALLQEVEELRARVHMGQTGPITSSIHAQEIAELKQSHEIKITRLKDAFKASSCEYRQACYQLLGWRIDRIKEGKYKLFSQYAESANDYLFFNVGEGVDLLETEFSATLGPLIERHLEIQHSVPMFLNAIQSELFSQQTVTNVLG